MKTSRFLCYSCIVPLLLLLAISNHELPQDFKGWLAVIQAMDEGKNPYQATTFLNWPQIGRAHV